MDSKKYGIDTSIIMYNGTIKKVQDIKIGDILIGRDSKAIKVLNLSQGETVMYKIKQTKGDEYIVDENHLLSLKVVQTNGKSKPINILGKKYEKSDIIDISVKNYSSLSKTTREANLKGIKIGIEFNEKELLLDPYILGLWLGDGTSTISEITNQDSKILKYLANNLPKYNCYLEHNYKQRKYNHYKYSIKSTDKINYVWDLIKNLKLRNNKHIPLDYKSNSRENRLKILAGLLDTDGSLDPRTKTVYEIIQKNKQLSLDIQFIARSLGFMCNIKECKKSCQTGTIGNYYRMNISGNGINEIPCLVKRKQSDKYKHNKDTLVTGIKIEMIENKQYYGIKIDSNNFLIHNDFTII